MRLSYKSLGFLLVLIIIILFYLPSYGQFYRLELNIRDTVLSANNNEHALSLYLRNWQDSVVGYSFVLYSSHPDVISFTGQFDTTGTLTEGWQLVGTDIYGPSLKMVALANTTAPPFTPGIGYPQTGEVPLIKIKATIGELPDTMTADYIEVYFSDNVSQTAFSDEGGNLIGIAYDPPTLDTHHYQCTEWVEVTPGDTMCMGWIEVSYPSDSMEVDSILNPYLDTAQVKLTAGKIYPTTNSICGDLNNDGYVNILDLTYFINWLYMSGTPPYDINVADINNDSTINLLDITYLIDYLYLGGPPPAC